MTAERSPQSVTGPCFDELERGMVLHDAPGVTLTEGMQAVHRSIVGDRLRLPLDAALAAEVVGAPHPASPALVWDVSIGQSTGFTQRVRANLFYRGLRFHRYPVIGDTLRTTTTVDALRENTRRPDRASTGLAALHIVTRDQEGRTVLDYWRCAMLPLSSEEAPAGPRDDMDAIGQGAADADPGAAARGWDLARFREHLPGGEHLDAMSPGRSWIVDGVDVVTSAPELARLTGNIAAVHHDAVAGGGSRLVYGGHTIGIALHQATRALPALVTVAGWTGCDHLGPVREGDRLRSRVRVEAVRPWSAGGGLVDLRVRTDALTEADEPRPVLDWAFTAVMA